MLDGTHAGHAARLTGQAGQQTGDSAGPFDGAHHRLNATPDFLQEFRELGEARLLDVRRECGQGARGARVGGRLGDQAPAVPVEAVVAEEPGPVGQGRGRAVQADA